MSEIIFKEDAIEAMLCQTDYRNVEDLENGIKEYYGGNERLCGVLGSINAVKGVQPVFCFKDERLKPKKPYVTKYTKIVECPNCKRRLRTTLTLKNLEAYCPKCGQAIDWSEVKK